eukprot:GHVU01090089.1.p1 GENE.GHVU01090089.1~~GHVU01090089.1.p1  ORF type:complete len:119 (-),score=7.06 GHVU01090089.1:147-503(-)
MHLAPLENKEFPIFFDFKILSMTTITTVFAAFMMLSLGVQSMFSSNVALKSKIYPSVKIRLSRSVRCMMLVVPSRSLRLDRSDINTLQSWVAHEVNRQVGELENETIAAEERLDEGRI